jgi:hypothetical protein
MKVKFIIYDVIMFRLNWVFRSRSDKIQSNNLNASKNNSEILFMSQIEE